ncbi:hypothetical protein N6H14_32785 [Paenibacillus sp. CC-CFT747]|nr:hypothetical protein N6H14_32785 [Paenibacillus sp. CC-CFT747]
MKKNVLVILIIGLLAGLAVYQNLSAKEEAVVLPSETAPKPQFLAPSFTLTGMDNQSYSVGGRGRNPFL